MRAQAPTAPAEHDRSRTTTDGAHPDPRLGLLLALADDELVIGHRHSHWTGVAPHLEEDLAFSSIAQDEVGHAVVWYTVAVDLVGPDGVRRLLGDLPDGASLVDALGLGRRPEDYRNAILVERPNRDWAYSLARQYLYDTAEDVRLQTLAESTCKPIADATGALRREERYHLMHARTWLERLAHGPVESRRRIAEGLTAAFREALALFEPVPGESELIADGTLAAPHDEQLQRWLDVVTTDLRTHDLERVVEEGSSGPRDGDFVPTSSGEMTRDDGRLDLTAPHIERDGEPGGADGTRRWVPVGEFCGRGGRHGRHSEDFADVWEEMTGTYRAHPGAKW